MKVNVTGLLMAAILSLPSLVSANDQQQWYIGINAGNAEADLDSIDAGELNSALPGFTFSNVDVDDSDTGFELLVGFQFNQYFALEASYLDLGELEVSTNFSMSTAGFGFILPLFVPLPATINGTVSVKQETKGLTLAAVGIIPLSERFSISGKAGLLQADVELTADGAITGPGPLAGGFIEVLDEDASETEYFLGLGVQFDLTDRLGITANWKRYFDVGDSDTGEDDFDFISAGLVFSF